MPERTPRVFSVGQTTPEDVAKVIDRNNRVWVRITSQFWWSTELFCQGYRDDALSHQFGPLTEVLPVAKDTSTEEAI